MSHRSQISFMPSATGISNLMLNFCPEMLTSGVTSQPTHVQEGSRGLRSQPFFRHPKIMVWQQKKYKNKGNLNGLEITFCVFACKFAFTSKIHLMSRCPMCLLFTLVTGNCDILKRAPVLLITFQCQFLGSGNFVTEKDHTSD